MTPDDNQSEEKLIRKAVVARPRELDLKHNRAAFGCWVQIGLVRRQATHLLALKTRREANRSYEKRSKGLAN